MRTASYSLIVATPLAVVLAAAAPSASADITGFNNLSGWNYNTSDNGTPPGFVGDDGLHFTTGPNNTRSIWFNTPQDISEFRVEFTYRAGSITASTARQGLTFAIQNSPDGLNALGGGGNGFGYRGITQSAAVTIETDTGGGETFSGFYTNGVLGGGSVLTEPVNAFDLTEIDVTITYNGSLLSVSMTDGVNTFDSPSYFVGSLASVVGDTHAYVGFTAGTFNLLGGGGGANQYLSNFRFTAVPSPATLPVMAALGIGVIRRRRM